MGGDDLVKIVCVVRRSIPVGITPREDSVVFPGNSRRMKSLNRNDVEYERSAHTLKNALIYGDRTSRRCGR